MSKLLFTTSIFSLVVGFASAQEILNTKALTDVRVNDLCTNANSSLFEPTADVDTDKVTGDTEEVEYSSQVVILAKNDDFYRINKGTKGIFFIVQDFYSTGEKRTEPFLVTDIQKARISDFDTLSYDRMAINSSLIIWFNNGQVERKGVFEQGKRKGLWISWYDNGQKRSSGHYQEGLREGTWTVWYQSGKRMQKGYFQSDRREGVWIYWYGNGKKKEAGRYDDDVRVERWNYWDDNGRLVKSGIKDQSSTIK